MVHQYVQHSNLAGEVKLFLCLTKRHAMKTYWVNGGSKGTNCLRFKLLVRMKFTRSITVLVTWFLFKTVLQSVSAESNSVTTSNFFTPRTNICNSAASLASEPPSNTIQTYMNSRTVPFKCISISSMRRTVTLLDQHIFPNTVLFYGQAASATSTTHSCTNSLSENGLFPSDVLCHYKLTAVTASYNLF